MMYTLKVTWTYWEKEKREMVVEVDNKSYPVKNGSTVDILVEQGFHNITCSLILVNGKKSPVAKVYTSITRNESITINTKGSWGPTVNGTLPGQKSKVVAALLNFFLGGFGAHRIYLGYGNGVLIPIEAIAAAMCIGSGTKLGEFFGGLILVALGIWEIVDFVRIVSGTLKPNNGTEYVGNAPIAVQMVQPVAPPALVHNAPAAAAPAGKDQMEMLEKLAKLHEQGILNDEEFQQKKKDLLAKL